MADFVELTPDQVLPPLVPMREEMDAQAFAELVADIRARGLLQPLVVSPEGDRFRLVAGWRRWRAAIEAGLATVPCMVRPMARLQQLTAMVAENLHREAANPLDEARVFATLEDEEGLTTEEIAQVTGKSPGYVATRLRLLRAPEDVRAALREGRVNLSVALELARVLHDQDRAWLLGHAMGAGVTADVARQWVNNALQNRRQYPAAAPVDPTAAAAPAPPEPTGLCMWHRGEVPQSSLRSLIVCQECSEVLEQVRLQLPAEVAPDGHAAPA